MVVRIIIEYDDDAMSIEDLNAMVENLKRNLTPRPRGVYFEYKWEP